MNARPMSACLAAAALLAACSTPEPAPRPWVDEARSVAATVPPKLLQVLQSEMDRGGPVGAIAACNEKAPAMARQASEQTGWAIRRVSLRNRNPRAVPDAWERAALEEFDRIAAARGTLAPIEKTEVVTGPDGRREQRYLRALPTQELCVACHGATEQMSPEVRARLQALYPADRATGYRVGDVRGALALRRLAP